MLLLRLVRRHPGLLRHLLLSFTEAIVLNTKTSPASRGPGTFFLLREVKKRIHHGDTEGTERREREISFGNPSALFCSLASGRVTVHCFR